MSCSTNVLRILTQDGGPTTDSPGFRGTVHTHFSLGKGVRRVRVKRGFRVEALRFKRFVLGVSGKTSFRTLRNRELCSSSISSHLCVLKTLLSVLGCSWAAGLKVLLLLAETKTTDTQPKPGHASQRPKRCGIRSTLLGHLGDLPGRERLDSLLWEGPGLSVYCGLRFGLLASGAATAEALSEGVKFGGLASRLFAVRRLII